MNSSDYLDRIKKVFGKNTSLIQKRRIIREADWQTWLYCDFKDEFTEEKDILILLEGRIKKGNNQIIWFSPLKYTKRKEILLDASKIEIDKSGWVKVYINPLDKINSKLKNILAEESGRCFYVDILIRNEKYKNPIAIIELKFHKRLNESFLFADIEKLNRIKNVVSTDCILIAVGYNLKEKRDYFITV